jgi:hypothetical protein
LSRSNAGGSRPPHATIRTVAQQLGVHPSTVSRALRGDGSGKISAEMRARVLEAAAAAGYQPNPWASSLRTSRTYALGLLIPHLVDVALAQMFEVPKRGRVSLATRPSRPERMTTPRPNARSSRGFFKGGLRG